MREVLPIRILVCEDMDLNQKLIKRSLEGLGYESDIVSNGIEALEKMQSTKYHLILMDLMMPEMGGHETTMEIVKQFDAKDRPLIIAMTASAMSGDRNDALKAGMDDYITKPFKMEDIKQIFDKWGSVLLEKI